MSVGIVINGTSRGGYLSPSSIRYSRPQLGSRGTADFVLNVADESGYEPLVGEDCALYDVTLSVRVFGGSIEQVVKERLGLSNAYRYTVSCTGNERKCDKRIIKARVYQNQTAKAIFLDILSKELSGEAFTSGTIDDGATISKIIFDGHTVSQAFDELASLSGFIWYSDPDSVLFFHAREIVTAPFTLTGADIRQKGSLKITVQRSDFRDRQYLRLSFAAFADDIESFAGDGSTQSFDISKIAKNMVSMVIGTNEQASVAGTFSSVPSNGDSIEINGVFYTFVTALDNSMPRQVLIGGSAGACASNFHHAVNDDYVNKGIVYSSGTTPHPNCDTTAPTGATLTARFKVLGALGNGIVVNSSSGAFSWAAGSMSGGVDGGDPPVAVSFGNRDTDVGSPWTWAPGETTIVQDSGLPALAVGQSITVTYQALGGDTFLVGDDAVVADRATVEGTTGVYENLTDRTDIVDGNVGIAAAQALLETYKELPIVIECETRRTGLVPGMLVPVDIANPAISGDYLVDAIDGYYVPSEAHFYTKLRLVAGSVVGVDSYLRFWESLAGSGGGAGFPLGITSARVNAPSGSTGIPGDPSITSADAIPSTDANGNPVMRVTITVNPPAPAGSTSSYWIWDDEPDSSIGGLSLADGSVPADGTVGTGGLFNPRPIEFRAYDANSPTITFDAPVVTSPEYYRVYVSSGSPQITPKPVQHGQSGETPSRQYLVLPVPDTNSASGREFAPLIRDFVLADAAHFEWASNPVYVTNEFGNQEWDAAFAWNWPKNDPQYSTLGGFNLVLAGPENKYLGNVPLNESLTESPLGWRFVILPGTNTYKVWAISYSTDGQSNTIVPGVTPFVSITITRVLGASGEEYTSLVTGVSWTITTATGSDGTARLNVLVNGTTPASIDDPSFGGVRLRLKRPSDTDAVALASARTLPLLYTIQKPSTSQSWTFSLTSLSTDLKENSIVIGVTPQTTVTVGGGADLNLGFAGSGFDTGPFQVTGSIFKFTNVAANYLIGGALQIGGPGMISISKYFDQLGSLIGWDGDNSADPNPNNRFVGRWGKALRAGGPDPLHAPFICDSSGNLSISVATGSITLLFDGTNFFKVSDSIANGASQLTPTTVRTGQVSGSRFAQLSSGGQVNGTSAAGNFLMTANRLEIDALPSSSPGAGSKEFWYDPSDSNRIKYAP